MTNFERIKTMTVWKRGDFQTDNGEERCVSPRTQCDAEGSVGGSTGIGWEGFDE